MLVYIITEDYKGGVKYVCTHSNKYTEGEFQVFPFKGEAEDALADLMEGVKQGSSFTYTLHELEVK